MLARSEREAQIVEQRLVVEIENAAELAALVDGQAVIAAIAVEPDGDEIDHLRKGERDHDEINAAGAQAERADHEREQRRSRDRDRPLHQPRRDTLLGEDADRIAADAEVGGMAEAHHAAVADDEIEAHRANRQDEHAGKQGEHEGVAGQPRIKRNEREARDENDGEGRERGQPKRRGRVERSIEPGSHLLAAGNSPSGRNTRIAAVSM